MTAPGDVVIDGLVVLLLSTGSLDQGARVTSPPQRDSPRPVNSVRPNRSRPSSRCARHVPRAGTSRAIGQGGRGRAGPVRPDRRGNFPRRVTSRRCSMLPCPRWRPQLGLTIPRWAPPAPGRWRALVRCSRYGEVFVVICCTRDRPKRPDCGWTCGLYPSCAGCLIVVRSVT